MLRTALVIDERVREMTGAARLVHSHYYNNEDVIKRVSDFIATGVGIAQGNLLGVAQNDART